MERFEFERGCFAQGFRYVAGVDEVGRGCLAGPVYAAAVILPQDDPIPGLRDSKKLSAAQRERFYAQILDQALAVRVASVSVKEIDRINIFHAAMAAMVQAVEALFPRAQCLLVDGKFPLAIALPQQALVKGDDRSASIAAASIVAKVERDRYMSQQDALYPEYGFAQHKGYGTRFHLEALERYGPTPLHRHSFAPVQSSLVGRAQS